MTLPFSPSVTRWFQANFAHPTEVQRRGWMTIAEGRHALLVAPTGSGKTLAAFLWGIDRLTQLPVDAPPGVRMLYISPLKALVNDVERNLRAPLAGVLASADPAVPLRPIRVDLRTGDTSSKARALQAKSPGEILVTTPESLFLILGSKAREVLRSVESVIVDEVHALAPTKRGVHLALSLERLVEVAEREPQRIGLSATARPLDEVARFLGGDRAVEIVDAHQPPRLDLKISLPRCDPSAEEARPVLHEAPGKAASALPGDAISLPPEAPMVGGSILAQLYARDVPAQPRPPPSEPTPTDAGSGERGLWPAIHERLLAEIRSARSTLIFVNSRGLCERLAQRLNELAEEELVLAHHGSVSHEQRRAIEERLKSGQLPAIVATSSLELGIDMGAIDRVLLVESPGSVARGLQRVGRAGHAVGELSVGRIYPKYQGDLLECAVVGQRMLAGEIESIRVPKNALDVLAQQIVAMVCDTPRSPEALRTLISRAYPYRALAEPALQATLEMLSGHFPSSDMADLRPLLVWDRASDQLTPRRGTTMLSRMNAGTIADRGNYAVHRVGGDGEGVSGPRVGELDEEMVFETRTGDVILLGASSWRVEQIERDRVLVSPAPGVAARLPFWRGEGPGRPIELGEAIGAFTRQLGELPPERRLAWLLAESPLDPEAAEALADYIAEQQAESGTLPTDRAITIERFRDELGDWRVCILTPFGARIHAPWAMALQRTLEQSAGFEIQLMYTDDGIVLRLADGDDLPDLTALIPEPEEVEERITEQLADTALFAGLFRENAVRSLLVPRRRPSQRNPLWAQRLKTRALLASVRRYEGFPITLETYRQALSDQFDLPGLKRLLRQIRSRELRIDEVETRSASPFARSLVFAYVATYIYEQDAPLAERRAQALSLDRNLLSELLGQAELRELIDPQVLAQLESELQYLTPERKASDLDRLHDLLRRLGDLTLGELAERSIIDPTPLLKQLEQQRRAIPLRIGGESRWIAADEAGLYRDALGSVPPSGLPESYLAQVEAPLERLLRRYARSHGPFTTREVATRYLLPPERIEQELKALERDGLLLYGEIRPGGSEREWCDRENLARLKRQTLAKLRQAVAAVDGATLGTFLPQWHGISKGQPGISSSERLEQALFQLQGLTLPWSALSQSLLPARVPGFQLDQLDMLAALGRIVWIGRGALGSKDGRIALYLRESCPLLLERSDYSPPGSIHQSLLAELERGGAAFITVLEQAALRDHPDAPIADIKQALWDLVWAGQITNDTFAPLRSLAGPARSSPGRSGSSRGSRRHTNRPWRSGPAQAGAGRPPPGTPLAGGRWYRVADLIDPELDPTERAVARAEMLLERYGIVSREAAQAEELPFAPLYKVLGAMEEAGRIRRGFFVEGLAGAQFAYLGAIERLRAARLEGERDAPCQAESAQRLAAIDPANPYGTLLPWPATGAGESHRPKRINGAWLILVEGRPILYLGANGRRLLTFPSEISERGELELAIEQLAKRPRGQRRSAIEWVDEQPIRESPLLAKMIAGGFESEPRGLVAGGR